MFVCSERPLARLLHSLCPCSPLRPFHSKSSAPRKRSGWANTVAVQAAVPAAAVAAAAICTAVPSTAAARMEPRILCSSFLGEAACPSEQQLAVVLLNWTLPALTPRLWHKGGVALGRASCSWHLTQPLPAHAHMQTCHARPPNTCTRTSSPAAATLRVCADGGANRLYDELPGMLPGQAAEAVRSQYLPSAIQGDLDSIRPDVLAFYRQHGVPVQDLSGGLTTAPRMAHGGCIWLPRHRQAALLGCCAVIARWSLPAALCPRPLLPHPAQPTRTAPTFRSAFSLCGSRQRSGGWSCGI